MRKTEKNGFFLLHALYYGLTARVSTRKGLIHTGQDEWRLVAGYTEGRKEGRFSKHLLGLATSSGHSLNI